MLSDRHQLTAPRSIETSPSRFKLLTAVYLILKQGDSVLLGLRQNTGLWDGYYGLVAGHLDGNEPASAGMAREALEEIGLQLEPNALTPKLVMHRYAPDREVIDIFFEIELEQPQIVNMEPHKCAELKYFSLNYLPENTIPFTREALKLYREGVTFTEYGWKAGEI